LRCAKVVTKNLKTSSEDTIIKLSSIFAYDSVTIINIFKKNTFLATSKMLTIVN